MVLSRAPLSYAYPLLGLNFVFVVLLSAVMLHEPVSFHRRIGVCMIVVGFVVAATNNNNWRRYGNGMWAFNWQLADIPTLSSYGAYITRPYYVLFSRSQLARPTPHPS